MTLRSELKQNFGVAIFATGGILVIPLQLYFFNAANFGYDLLLLLIPAILALAILVLGIKSGPSDKVQYFLSGLGLAIMICDQFMRADFGPLDGSSEAVDPDYVIAGVSALYFVALPYLAVRYGSQIREYLISLAAALGLTCLALIIFLVSLSVINTPATNRATTTSDVPAGAAVRGRELPNVYLIWLDALESTYLARYLQDPRAPEVFRDFVFYRNNSANYLFTPQSFTSIMSGQIYKGGDYEEWQSERQNLKLVMHDLGYRNTSYAKSDFLVSSDDIAISSQALYNEANEIRHPFLADFVTFWLARSVPSILANPAIDLGKLVGSGISDIVNRTPIEASTISEGIEPSTGVFTLRQFIADEDNRADRNEFVMVQAILPHGPYVIDRNCKYRGRVSGQTSSEAYFEQVVCAADLVSEFLLKLRRLDRYDRSMIVIMGDHGSGWNSLMEGDNDTASPLNAAFTPWSKDQVLARASAALMVKYPGSAQPSELTFSDRESQLVDIYPTILSAVTQSGPLTRALDGIDLARTEPLRRPKYITYFKPGNLIVPFLAEIYDLEYAPEEGLTDLKFRSTLAPPPDPEISCNEARGFSDLNIAATGLAARETWGVWSEGARTTIDFRLAADCRPTHVRFQLSAFVSQDNEFQSASVFANDQRVGTVEVRLGEPTPKEFVFQVPKATGGDTDILRFRFEIDSPTAPDTVGSDGDSRLLGLGFSKVTFFDE